MRFWIIVLPRERMDLCVKLGTFGLSKKFILGGMSVGDRIACYITKEKKIAGFGTVTASYYVDDKPIFGIDEGKIYPDRVDFTAKLLSSDNEIDFAELLDDMQFITNRSHWSARFAGGLCEISEHDWKCITKKVDTEVTI